MHKTCKVTILLLIRILFYEYLLCSRKYKKKTKQKKNKKKKKQQHLLREKTMKVLHLMDNGIVQSLALVSLWIVHDNCDSVELLACFASWHVFPLNSLLKPLFVGTL